MDVKNEVIRIIGNINKQLLESSEGNWIEDGMLDSFDIITIISNLQETFQIEIDPQYILPENFANVKQITKMIEEIM